MKRMKLGLFGAARWTDARTTVNEADVAAADTRERMAGLTPIEVAPVEAMSRRNVATLSAH